MTFEASDDKALAYLEGKAPFDIVLDLLRRTAADHHSRDRIALASTFSHGEAAWVSECSWHGAHRGISIGRETSVAGAARVDLVVAGAGVEFKSTFGAWAFDPKAAAERERWLGPDLEKLGRAQVGGVVVVTVAALGAGVHHLRPAFKVDHDHIWDRLQLTPVQVLEAGLMAAEQFLAPRCLKTERVLVPAGEVPPNVGQVLLGAVVGAVNEQALHP